MALGLAYIHHENIIHRDLKSLNILLNNDYQVKISDFGLSRTKITSSSQSTKNSAVGTIRWMAPELLKGQKYSEQSDVYALGMIIWEIVAKCTIPFKDIDNNLVGFRIISGGKETTPDDVPQNIQVIIQGCWKDNPSERTSLEEILKNIEENLKQTENLSETAETQRSEETIATEYTNSLVMNLNQLNIQENQETEQKAQIIQAEPFPSSSK